ncbi:MAG: tetratricopeptide repeat protein [Chitinophagaceae bacterium]|nr:tetratricopeptide repeat protein [Chitinophagaceae bacterium]
MKKITLTIILFFAIITLSNAQFSLSQEEDHKFLREAIREYDMAHFMKSNTLLESYFEKRKKDRKNEIYFQTAMLYKQLNNLRLNQKNAIENMELFLAKTPYTAQQNLGNFLFAKYLFQNEMFAKAIQYYEKSSIDYLSNDEIAQRNFELAYCYLINKEIQKVNPLLNTVKNINGEYFQPGNYYHGIITYYQGNYNDALSSFKAIEQNSIYKNIVPFYLAEINYFKGDKKEAMAMAKKYVSNEKNDLSRKEWNLLLAQLYVENNNFDDAEKQFKQYVLKTNYPKDEDYLLLGYLQFQNGDIENAIRNLEKIKEREGQAYQEANYILANSYLKNGEKENALKKMQLIDANKLDNTKKEQLLYNIAKLNYEIGEEKDINKLFVDYLKGFPQGKYKNDINEMLAIYNLKNKNFEEANKAMQQIYPKSIELKSIYQKANYARGIQLLIDENYSPALNSFNESLKENVDENIAGLCQFWKAECNYRLGNYNETVNNINQFLNKPGAGNGNAIQANANLSKTYAHLHLNQKNEMKSAYQNYMNDSTSLEMTESQVIMQLDSLKPNFVPSHVPFVEPKMKTMVYNMSEPELQFEYQAAPLKPLPLNIEHVQQSNMNFVKAGIGNYTSNLLGVSYTFENSLSSPIYLEINHRASKNRDAVQQRIDQNLVLKNSLDFRDYTLNGKLEIDRDVFYNTPNQKENLSNRIRYINPRIGVEIFPKNEKENVWKKNAYVELGIFGNNTSGKELNFKLKENFSKKLNEEQTFSVGSVLDVNSFSSTAIDNLDDNKTGSSILLFTPKWQLRKQDYEVEIGLYPAIGQKFYLLPNLSFSKKIDALYSTFKASMESNVDLNNYKSLATLNPYMSNIFQSCQSRNHRYILSMFGSPKKNINYLVKTGIGRTTNLLTIDNLIVNPYQRFNIDYLKTATLFILNLQVDYQLNFETLIGANVQYEPVISHSEDANANFLGHYLPLKTTIYGKYNYNQKLFLEAQVFANSKTKTRVFNNINQIEEIKMNGVIDANLKANYPLHKNWILFGEANNIFGNKYSRWYGFPSFGTNFILGAYYQFSHLKKANTKN